MRRALLLLAMAMATATASLAAPWDYEPQGVELDMLGVTPSLRTTLKQACSEALTGTPRDRLLPALRKLKVRQAVTSTSFVEKTGLPAGYGAATVGETLWLAPMSRLRKVGDLNKLLQHECAHLRLRQARMPRMPRVLEEGVALWLTTTRAPIGRCTNDVRMLDIKLRNARTPAAVRDAYKHIQLCLHPLLDKLPSTQLLRVLQTAAGMHNWWDVMAPDRSRPFQSLSTAVNHARPSTSSTPVGANPGAPK